MLKFLSMFLYFHGFNIGRKVSCRKKNPPININQNDIDINIIKDILYLFENSKILITNFNLFFEFFFIVFQKYSSK